MQSYTTTTETHTHREGKEHTKENGHRDKASKAQQKKKGKSFKNHQNSKNHSERRLKNKQNKQALNTLWHHQKIQEAKLNFKKKKTNKIYKHKPFDAP